MKRTPLKRTPLKRSQKRLNRVSKKRLKQNNVYKEVRKDFLNKNKKCQVCSVADANQVHHKKGRWGERLNDANYFLATCSHCHHLIHADPAWAYANGLMVRR